MTERVPTTTFNHEQNPKEQDSGAAFIDVARELRVAINENANSGGDVIDDSNEDDWDMFEQDGIDGMYELLHLANEARRTGDADRGLKPYESTLIDHMQTEVEFHKAQSHLDLDALSEPIDGVDEPRKQRIQEVIDKLRAEDDPANENKIGALETYIGFMDEDESGHEARDFVMSHQVVEATPDEQSRTLAEGFAARATDDLRRVTDRNIISAEAYKVLAEYYPGTPDDMSDLEEDPRLAYVPTVEEENFSPLDDTAEVAPVVTATPDAMPVASPAEAAKAAKDAAEAERKLELEMAESELAEARNMMAQAARGLFSKSSPELEALYAQRKQTAGKMWLEDELKKRKIENPTAKQLTYLASLHAIGELNSLTMATNASMEKTAGRKFIDLAAKHPVLMGAGAMGFLTLTGIGIPAAAAGTVGMILYSKFNRRFRGAMSGAEKTVSSTELKNDMLVGSVDMGNGTVDRDLLFDSASEHMHNAYSAERHRQRLRNMGIPLSEVERYLKRYTRGLGKLASRGAGVGSPGSRYAPAAA